MKFEEVLQIDEEKLLDIIGVLGHGKCEIYTNIMICKVGDNIKFLKEVL